MLSFKEPPDLDVPFVDRIGDSRPKTVQAYTLDNPHPGFGKDPNILDEYGHTLYPKMVYPDGPMTVGKVVHNAEEEAKVMGDKATEQPKAGW